MNNKLWLCEEDCEFNGYNNKSKKPEFNCPIKIKLPSISEIIVNKEKLMDNFVEVKFP